MRPAIIFLCLLLGIRAGAQDFEGTIRWSVESEMDPAVQQQMQQMLEMMQQQMEDPQNKAMMESNPQMKAQMEAMKGNLMPSEITVRIKGLDVLTNIVGGVMPMEIFSPGSESKSYHLNRADKTYSILNASDSPQSSPKVVKTGETMKILGYPCTKYLVDAGEAAGGEQTMWVTTAIKGPNLTELAKRQAGSVQKLFIEGLDGVPLRVEMKTPQFSMTMEVVEVKKGTLSADLFRIPEGYTETQMTMPMGPR